LELSRQSKRLRAFLDGLTQPQGAMTLRQGKIPHSVCESAAFAAPGARPARFQIAERPLRKHIWVVTAAERLCNTN